MQCSCDHRSRGISSACRTYLTRRLVDDRKQTDTERWQDPADLAWHWTAARQAHCQSTPADSSSGLDTVLGDQLHLQVTTAVSPPVVSALHSSTITDK